MQRAQSRPSRPTNSRRITCTWQRPVYVVDDKRMTTILPVMRFYIPPPMKVVMDPPNPETNTVSFRIPQIPEAAIEVDFIEFLENYDVATNRSLFIQDRVQDWITKVIAYERQKEMTDAEMEKHIQEFIEGIRNYERDEIYREGS